MNNVKTSQTGFLPIEVLIVAALIAIQAAVATPGFLEAQLRCAIASAKINRRTSGATTKESLFSTSDSKREVKTMPVSVEERCDRRAFTEDYDTLAEYDLYDNDLDEEALAASVRPRSRCSAVGTPLVEILRCFATQ